MSDLKFKLDVYLKIKEKLPSNMKLILYFYLIVINEYVSLFLEYYKIRLNIIKSIPL